MCTLYSYEAAVLEIDSLLTAPAHLKAAGWRRHVHSAGGGGGSGGGSGGVENGATFDGPSGDDGSVAAQSNECARDLRGTSPNRRGRIPAVRPELVSEHQTQLGIELVGGDLAKSARPQLGSRAPVCVGRPSLAGDQGARGL